MKFFHLLVLQALIILIQAIKLFHNLSLTSTLQIKKKKEKKKQIKYSKK